MAVESIKKTWPAIVALESNKQKEFVHKIKKIKEKYADGLKPDRGVIYLGHIPHGFYETEMKSFFSQFGRVTRLRLSRSKKTGNSKGYAFIEFEDAEVAQIAADTMNNYLMFERILKCKLVSSDKVHPALFHGCNRSFKKPKSSKLSIERHNTIKTESKLKKLRFKSTSKQQKKLAKLAALGVELDLNSFLVTSTKRGKLVTPNTPMTKKVNKSEVVETPIQRIVPEKITTQDGDLMVLLEDESEEEITFKTPPNSIRSSKLTASGKRNQSSGETPRTSKIISKLATSPELSIETSFKLDVETKEVVPKKVKKEVKEDTPKSSEKPKRMITRAVSKKLTTVAKGKLKTPPSKPRQKK